MRDSFYTTTTLAEKLINFLSDRDFGSVVDFCIGDGELIRAAQNKWKNIQCFGVDISDEVISELNINHPNWSVATCDFTDDSLRNECSITENNRKYDLILLNPPFTCKGSSIYKVYFSDKEYKMSRAMMFVVKALQYLNENGVLLAILPISCAYSKKDNEIWECLKRDFSLKILEERDKEYFKKCNPNIVLVSINYNSKPIPLSNNDKSFKIIGLKKTIFRGNLSVYERKDEISNKSRKFVHTTNLINNTLQNLNQFSYYPKSEVTGPAVLIPRVGNPSVKKICIISKDETYVISDCIIAIKTSTQQEALTIMQIFVDNWDYFKTLYKGTAAKYITMDRLQKLFEDK